jgi:hypothetical protein
MKLIKVLEKAKRIIAKKKVIKKGKKTEAAVWKFPKEIDFRYIELGSKKKFRHGSKEYNLLNDMKEADWEEYVNALAASGVTVEYDNVTDTFKVQA